ncbi:molybdenum cofactor biosynthesis prote [Aureobasidium pullulans]|uniref:Molybdenum cofactor biosynthesis prote n=1 Tax=Aureobasidium pullulans TaxID=5580 RepID=A0A4V4L0C1_AURPU|nr:molybdenum cofactor biosynthesis prote [Aureobasidium pullulans]
MALAAIRSSRNLGPLTRRLRPTRRNIATATAQAPSSASLDQLPHHVGLNDRRQAIKQAKPFSDFLTDKYNRQHDYLRISVTERCNLRCLYCMPEEGVPLSPQKHLLTTPEIVYLSELFVNQGVTKIRLTGGEPTVRPDILPLMQQIGNLKTKGLRELALTTNAISLHRKLDKMIEAGLTGVNISLDTLDPFQFQILTRRKGYDAVMKSINRVLEVNKLGAGVKLKVNCVVMRGINERELIPFVEMGREKDIEVRFIEYMPFGGNKWSERKMLTYQEMLDIIREKYPALRSVKGHLNDTSKTYEIPGFVGKIGFITSMTHNFCGTCNRLRITGDGNLKVCLHGNTEVSLRDLMRKNNNNDPMDEQAFEAVREMEMNRRQGLPTIDSRPGWIERETELLNLIGEARYRLHATAFPNYQMDLADAGPDTDLVVAEGDQRTRPAPRNFNARPTSSSRLGCTIPFHLLHPGISNSSGVRMYSSSSSSSSPPSAADDKTSESEEHHSDAVPAPSTANSEPQQEFASLRGLFGTPKRTWSQPSDTTADAHAVSAAPPQQPAAVVSYFDNNPFEDELPDLLPMKREKSEAHYISSGGEKFDQPHVNVPFKGRSDTGVSLGPTLETSGPSPPRSQPHKSAPLQVRYHKVASKDGWENQHNSPRLQKLRRTRHAPNQAKPLPTWKVDSSASGSPPSRQDGQHTENSTSPRSVNLRKAVSTVATEQGSSPFSDGIPSPDLQQNNALEAELTQESGAQASKDTSTPSSGPREDAPANSGVTLTHLTSTGEAHMVDVGQKEATDRVAVAVGFVHFSNLEPHRLITENLNKKGDVLGIARIAGIMGAKRCSDIIPLCHPIPITKVTVNVGTHSPSDPTAFKIPNRYGSVSVEARVHTHGKTGVEMEAISAVTAACMTVYDMCKAVDKKTQLGRIHLVYKHGGRSGTFLWPKFQQPLDRYIWTDEEPQPESQKARGDGQ